MLALNWLIILYVLIASGFIALSSEPNRRWYLIVNGLIIVWLIMASTLTANQSTLYAWTPLLLLPLLHRSTTLMTTAIHNKTYDDAFIRFEKRYFPMIMNVHHYNRANSQLLSEYLHACYLSFYLLLYGIPLYFYLTHHLTPFYECSFAILLVLLSCFVTHALIPVNGPRNIFTKINDHRRHGLFFKCVHRILADGSTPGTAFPSGHTAVASIILLMTWHLNPLLCYFTIPIGLGIIVSTIYGRFHYVVDVIFGIVYAVIAYGITLYLYD